MPVYAALPLSDVMATLQQQWGPRALRPMRDLERDTPTLPTGFPALDAALGRGGIPRGHITALSGAPTAGLRTLALHIITQAQATGSVAVYLDLGQTFDPAYAVRCGVALDDLLLVWPQPPAAALTLLADLVASQSAGIIVLDIPPEVAPALGEADLSAALRHLAPALARSGGALLCLSGENSSQALRHHAALCLRLTRTRWLRRRGDVPGWEVEVTVLKDKLAAPLHPAPRHLAATLDELLAVLPLTGDLTELHVTLDGLGPALSQQLSLFDALDTPRARLERTVQHLAARYGQTRFAWPALHDPAALLPERRFRCIPAGGSCPGCGRRAWPSRSRWVQRESSAPSAGQDERIASGTWPTAGAWIRAGGRRASGTSTSRWSRTRVCWPCSTATCRTAIGTCSASTIERPMSDYVELHCHSNFSLLDGAAHPEELVERAATLGMEALALTDHDAVYGAVRFVQAAREAGIRPILGAELTLAGGHHLTLLVEDQTGWQNLCWLITAARRDAPKGEAALPPDALAGHTAGLLALSGCRQGPVAAPLLRRDRRAALRAACHYRDLFGPGRLWIELQHHLLPQDNALVTELSALARHLGLETVATNNVHYATPDRHRLQDVLVCIRHTLSLAEAGARLRPNSEYCLKSGEAMRALFAACPPRPSPPRAASPSAAPSTWPAACKTCPSSPSRPPSTPPATCATCAKRLCPAALVLSRRRCASGWRMSWG